MADLGVTVELCIQSNLLTGAVHSPEEYAKLLKTLDEFDIPYTFSTDAPALQLTTLAGEVEYLLSKKAITAEQVIRAFENADRATFLAPESKT